MIFKSIYLTFITQTQNPKDLNLKFLLLSTLSLLKNSIEEDWNFKKKTNSPRFQLGFSWLIRQ